MSIAIEPTVSSVFHVFADLLSKDSYPRRITDDNPYASDKSRRHLYGHHHTQFENETFNGLSPRSNLGERFNKKQHFVHGKVSSASYEIDSFNRVLTNDSI